MSFTKIELKKYLNEMGINIVKGNFILKSDLDRFLNATKECSDTMSKFHLSPESGCTGLPSTVRQKKPNK